MVGTLSAVLVAAGRSYYVSQYPYGWSYCCDKQLWSALEQYAEDHGGAFPAGEATPEACLSLLYPRYADANLLRGKTVPLTVVQATLDRGERLGPQTCGWHYVPGLRLDDDPSLALAWDKAGLGHNGERLPQGGHYVLFLGVGVDHVPASKWEAFLQEQERLWAVRPKARQGLKP
jgi:hypothetical protein